MNELDIETAVNMWPTWDKMEKTIRTLMAKRPVHMERAIEQSREKYVTKEQLYTQLLKFLCKWEDVRKVIEKQIIPF
ncbi:MAG: hypothetical protein HUJ93_06945, partial [Bacteroidales bacterium]|nr:hypothetical protein [Bacteroidales bacterium]